MPRLRGAGDGEVVHVLGWRPSPYPAVATGSVVSLEPPAGQIFLNTGMRVVSDRALFHTGKLPATLERRGPSPSTGGACGSGEEGQEEVSADKAPS